MRRRLFNVVIWGTAAVSLVLCAAMIALWVRSREGHSDSVMRYSATSDGLQRCTGVTTTDGILFLGYDLRATARAPQEGGALLDRRPECGAVAAGPTVPTKAA